MSGISIATNSPPFVEFEYQEYGVNAEASAKAGRPIPAVKLMVTIRQRGDKFQATEKIAEEWISHIEREAIAGRYNPEWVQRFKMQYEAFVKGEALPEEGTPIKTWFAITKEQAVRCFALDIKTVEDLASWPDSGLGQIGLDGRYLRDLAKNHIEAGKGTGVLAKRLAELEEESRQNKATIERLSQQLTELKGEKTLHVPSKKAA